MSLKLPWIATTGMRRGASASSAKRYASVQKQMADVEQIQVQIGGRGHVIGQPLHERSFGLAIPAAQSIDI
jgi:hypothetical protein